MERETGFEPATLCLGSTPVAEHLLEQQMLAHESSDRLGSITARQGVSPSANLGNFGTTFGTHSTYRAR